MHEAEEYIGFGVGRHHALRLTVSQGFDTDEVDAAVDQARSRFLAGFEARCDQIASLIPDAASGDITALAHLIDEVHRIGGIGGMVGLPTVSVRGRELEDLIRDAPDSSFDAAVALRILESLRRAVDEDMAR